MSLDSEILDRLTDLVGRRDLSQQEFNNWLGGSPTGGPDGDGYYPLTDGSGFTRFLPSPAKLASDLEDSGTGTSAPSLATFGVTAQLAWEAFFSSPTATEVIVPPDMADQDIAVIGTTATSINGDGFPLAPGVAKRIRFMRPPGGASIRQARARPSFRLKRNYLWVEDVSAIIEDEGVSLTDDPTYVTNNLATRITIANARTVHKGQLIKLVADDLLKGAKPHVNPALRRRAGIMLVVAQDSTGNQITVAGRLDQLDTYTQNVRLAAYDDAPLEIYGGTVDYDDAVAASILAGDTDTIGLWAAIELIGIPNVRIDGLRIRRGLNSGVVLRDCPLYKITNCHISDLLNVPSQTRFGYAVIDFSCTGGMIDTYSAVNCRHAFDTGTGDVLADSDPSQYGRTRNMQVSTIASIGCKNGIGSHDEVYGLTIDGFIVDGHFQDASSGGAGAVMRGFNVHLKNGTIKNCRQGISAACLGRENLIENVQVDDVWLGGLYVGGGARTSADDNDLHVTVKRSSFFQRLAPTPGTSFDGVLAFAGDVEGSLRASADLEDVTFGIRGTGTPPRLVEIKTATLKAKGLKLDLSDFISTGDIPAIFSAQDYDSSVLVKGFEIEAADNAIAQLITAPGPTPGKDNNDPLLTPLEIRNIDYRGSKPFGGIIDGVAQSFAANPFAVFDRRFPTLKVSGSKSEGADISETRFLPLGVHSGITRITITNGGDYDSVPSVVWGNLPAGTAGVDYALPNTTVVMDGRKVVQIAINTHSYLGRTMFERGWGFRERPTITLAGGGGAGGGTATASLLEIATPNIAADDPLAIIQFQGGQDIETLRLEPTCFAEDMDLSRLNPRRPITFINRASCKIICNSPRLNLPSGAASTIYLNDFGSVTETGRIGLNRVFEQASGVRIGGAFTVNVDTMALQTLHLGRFAADIVNITLPATRTNGAPVPETFELEWVSNGNGQFQFVAASGASLLSGLPTKAKAKGVGRLRILSNRPGEGPVYYISGDVES